MRAHQMILVTDSPRSCSSKQMVSKRKSSYAKVLLTLAFFFMAHSVHAALVVTVPDNLFAGLSTDSDSSGSTSSQAVDNLIGDSGGDNGLLFSTAADTKLAISGFNADVDRVRLFLLQPQDGTRFPTSVSIRSSSTAQTSLLSGDYETLVGNFSWVAGDMTTVPGQSRNEDGYIDLVFSSPVNAQSMFFDFGGSTSGARISEVQGFAAVTAPEPTSLTLAVLGLLGLGLGRRRRRSQR